MHLHIFARSLLAIVLCMLHLSVAKANNAVMHLAAFSSSSVGEGAPVRGGTLPPPAGGYNPSSLQGQLDSLLSLLSFAPGSDTASLPGAASLGSGSIPAPSGVTWSTTTPSICAVTGGTVQALSLGTCSISASISADSNFKAGNISGDFEVSAINPALSFDIPSTSLTGIGQSTSVPLPTGGGASASASDYTFSGTAGVCSVTTAGNTVTITSDADGACVVSVQMSAHGVWNGSASLSDTIQILTPNVADALSNGDPITADSLAEISLASNVVTDLTTNNNCGSDGSTNCLDWFNTLTDSTSCVMPDGATDAQQADYISCVMIEGHTAIAESTVIPTPGSDVSLKAGCASTTITLPVPATCGHPQWECSSSNLPTGWTMDNNGVYVDSASAYTGSKSISIDMALQVYTPAYVKTVSKSYNVGYAVAAASNGWKVFSRGIWNMGGTWPNWAKQKCESLGGQGTTRTDLDNAPSGLLTNGTFYVYGTTGGDYNVASHHSQEKSQCSRTWPSNHKFYESGGFPYCDSGSAPGTAYYVCKGLPTCD